MQEGIKSGNISETCRKHGISPSLLYRRRNEAKQGAKAALGGRSTALTETEKDRRIRQLEHTLGRKSLEIEILKNVVGGVSCGAVHSQARELVAQAQVVHMNRTWLYNHIGEGKSDESRKPVPIGKRVTEFLRGWHGETPYAAATDWVFPSFKLRGKKPISGSQFVKDYIRPQFIQYGVIDAEYRGRAGLHAFRHSLATVLITEEQVDPKTAQGILRHATSDVTMDIYTHAQDGAKRRALERYESRLVQ